MKKEYINPEIEVVKLVSNPLLQNASPNAGGPVQEGDPVLSNGFFDNGDSNESW